MTAMLYGQVAVNALMLGATYALIAVGLSLVFSIMRVIQFAHGNLYMLGAYCVFYLATELSVNYFAALFIAAIAVGLLGMILDRVFLRPLRGQDLPSMIVTLGLLLLIEGSALLAFGERDKRFHSPVDGAVWFFDAIVIPSERLMILGVAAPLIALLFLFVLAQQGGPGDARRRAGSGGGDASGHQCRLDQRARHVHRQCARGGGGGPPAADPGADACGWWPRRHKGLHGGDPWAVSAVSPGPWWAPSPSARWRASAPLSSADTRRWPRSAR